VNGVSPPAELAQVLSPSQVRCFMDCQARWWFKHSLRYPDPPSGNMALRTPSPFFDFVGTLKKE
jgi:hypothetical protein